jgi:hypothetical protein
VYTRSRPPGALLSPVQSGLQEMGPEQASNASIADVYSFLNVRIDGKEMTGKGGYIVCCAGSSSNREMLF